MSLGGDRVRISFNPSDNALVDRIKALTAELIDLCEQHKHDEAASRPNKLGPSEAIRCWALAQTHYEIAAMFGVKAATA